MLEKAEKGAPSHTLYERGCRQVVEGRVSKFVGEGDSQFSVLNHVVKRQVLHSVVLGVDFLV